jgi:hypothetical protein
MAWETGTATSYLDLAAKVRDFLKSNAALVAAGQNWTQLYGPAAGALVATDQLAFQGPGLAGDDQILVCMKFVAVPGSNLYNINLFGLTAWNPSLAPIAQPNPSPDGRLLLINGSIKYWIIANGRCFKIITRISSQYDQAYAGFILPEHLPTDYPYPLFIGGSYISDTQNNSNNDAYRRAFWNGNVTAQSVQGVALNGGNAVLCVPDLSWKWVGNKYGSSGGTGSVSAGMDAIATIPWNPVYYNPYRYRQTITGERVLWRGGLATYLPPLGRVFYGRFDGVFFVPAFGSSAESIVTVGGVDHLIVPDIFRSEDGGMAAFALE